MKSHLESAFEESIEAYLLAHGWVQGSAGDYDRPLGVDTEQLFTFLGATQMDAWEKLIGLHGSQERARQKFARRVADEVTSRGAVDVLRRGVKDLGVQVDLAYFAPAHGLTPQLGELYGKNRVTVTRQAAVSESKVLDTVDLLFGVNGIPIATVELKTPTTGQTVVDAMTQYRRDRNPADLVFRARTVVHFAVDPNTATMTTRLAGQETVFLPFNQGSNGPGVDGGKGKPGEPGWVPDGVPVGAGVGAGQLAGPARVVRPRGDPARQDGQEDRDDDGVPTVPPVGRGHPVARCRSRRGTRPQQADSALRWVG